MKANTCVLPFVFPLIIAKSDKSEGRMIRRCKQIVDDRKDERILEIERRSTRSHSVGRGYGPTVKKTA